MPADYQASRDRDARFAKRFVFVLICLDGAAVGLFGALALATGSTDPIRAWVVVHVAIAVVALAIALSGKIFK